MVAIDYWLFTIDYLQAKRLAWIEHTIADLRLTIEDLLFTGGYK